ncbi:MAG: hypothetical protein CVU07_04485 [Bacteroidetes bacterium HGW-Bacteroidetes-23]|nr:MAG: hypothetical protein CVU07_04485 [Bacteroidetes bacterium HGW-Bacteroidetes-23]
MKNYYKHTIDLKKLVIRNDTRENFVQKLEEIEYRGYEVEQLTDGRKIVITKPGGKSVYGRPKKEDFLVFIFQPKENGLWQITHKQILDDLYAKSKETVTETLSLINLLQKTFEGEEPSDFTDAITALKFQNGESPESLIKAYKWIWGQEDVNYPNGEGRKMSWAGIEKLRSELL